MTDCWTRTEACRGCSGPVVPVLDLGMLPLVNDYAPIGSSEPITLYPHTIEFCERCGLAQQSGAVAPEVLFGKSYPYTSSTTRALRDNFAQLHEESQRINPLGPNDLVLDIGGNDGNLLSNFSAHRTLNVTPEDVGAIGVERGIPHHQAYWSEATARDVLRRYGWAKLVTATNVFAHTPDPHSFLEGVLQVLAPGGMLVLENHYLPQLLRDVQYETCYLEHDRLLSLQSIRHQLGAHGLQVIGARAIPTHGGSIRVYAMRIGETRPMATTLGYLNSILPDAIHEDGVTRYDFAEFGQRVRKHRSDLLRLIGDIRRMGMTIAGVGAPSRASTLVSYCGLNADDLACVYEAPGSHKLAKWMPGTRIPIVEEPASFGDAAPDFLLLLSWHIGHELKAALRAKGFRGKFIKPLPTVEVFE